MDLNARQEAAHAGQTEAQEVRPETEGPFHEKGGLLMPRSSKSKVSARGKMASAKGQSKASSVGKRAATSVSGSSAKRTPRSVMSSRRRAYKRR